MGESPDEGGNALVTSLEEKQDKVVMGAFSEEPIILHVERTPQGGLFVSLLLPSQLVSDFSSSICLIVVVWVFEKNRESKKTYEQDRFGRKDKHSR